MATLKFKFGLNLPTFVMAKLMLVVPMGIYQCVFQGMPSVIDGVCSLSVVNNSDPWFMCDGCLLYTVYHKKEAKRVQ